MPLPDLSQFPRTGNDERNRVEEMRIAFPIPAQTPEPRSTTVTPTKPPKKED